jgi:hypothetical protein
MEGHCALDGKRRRRAGRDDHLNIEGDQLGDEGRKASVIPFCPSVLDPDVLAHDVAKLT